jgi:hypothetical protein
MTLFIVFLAQLLVIFATANESKIVLETSDGPIEGERVVTSAHQSIYHAYRRIPYAQAPINDRRFQVFILSKHFHIHRFIVTTKSSNTNRYFIGKRMVTGMCDIWNNRRYNHRRRRLSLFEHIHTD